MKKLIIILFQILCFSNLHAQEANSLWKEYFSYNAIKDIHEIDDKIYIAVDNAYFVYDTKTNSSKKTTTIEGLSGDLITQIHHSKQHNKTIIGCDNGLVIVVDDTNGSFNYLIGILNKTNILSNRKKINDFQEFNNKLYISTSFGITELDLLTTQLGDTFFIGSGGAIQDVKQTAIINNSIYAITAENGLLKANINNPFLIDFNQWTNIQTGNWNSITNVDEKVYLTNNNGTISILNNDNSLQTTYSSLQPPKSLKFKDNKFILTTNESVYLFDNIFNLIFKKEADANLKAPFITSVIVDDNLFIGTQMNGVNKLKISNPTDTSNISPIGPEINTIFRVKTGSNNTIYTLFGGYNRQYNPYAYCCGGPSRYGVSYFSDDNWKSYNYDDILQSSSIVSFATNPKNKDELFFGSFFNGLVNLKKDKLPILYNQTNSTLDDDLIPNVTLVNTLNYDTNGDLWMTNSRSFKALNVLRQNGQWQSYSFESLSTNAIEDSYSSLTIDKNGTKWTGSYRSGVIAYNEKLNKSMVLNPDKSKLPHTDVRSLAIDQNNQLWIGTFKGLRIIPNVNSFLTENNIETKQIIILENGLAQELFYQSNILDIAVDGSNSKWISIEESGVFLVSSDGQKTKYHFTKENSPLPSNTILDIEINPTTGEVFFATDRGMVSFNGFTTSGTNDYSKTHIFPNPYRPEHKDTVKITGLKDKSNVKITDVEGNLVFEAISQGGTVEWDTRSFSKQLVSSGVYLVLISDKDGEDTTYRKLLIVR